MASSSILLRSPSVDPYNPPHHQPTHEPSPSSLSHASQIPLPATPSTPSRRRQREAEEEAEETVGRRKRVETGGSAGSAGEKLKEVREEAESSTSGRAPPVEQEQMVDGKRIKELPFEYMQAPEEDLVILIGQFRLFFLAVSPSLPSPPPCLPSPLSLSEAEPFTPSLFADLPQLRCSPNSSNTTTKSLCFREQSISPRFSSLARFSRLRS